MAGVPIKFRCYKCNQLLGVSRAKVGTEITCPKCSTGLIVPDPVEPSAPAGPAPSQETTPAFLAALAAGVPIEIADIRPEDIRADPGPDWIPPIETAAVPSPSEAAPAPAPPPGVYSTLIDAVDVERFVSPLSSRPDASPSPIPGLIPVPPASPAAVEPSVSSIRVEPPSLVAERPTVPRSRDLVLPRSVVASWSLFVLMSQALAFVAGLLAGHYIWRVH